jgi:hypothetical protein
MPDTSTASHSPLNPPRPYPGDDLYQTIQESNAAVKGHASLVDLLRCQLRQVVTGQEHLLERLLVGLLSGGHLLLEGLPVLAPVRPNSGPFHPAIVPYYCLAWYLTTAGCLLALLSLSLLLRLRRRRALQPDQLKRQQLRKTLATDLEQLAAALKQGSPDQFFNLAKGSIARQLGPRFNLEPATLTLADLERRLPAASPLLALFQRAEGALYGAGCSLDKAELADCYRLLQEELATLA